MAFERLGVLAAKALADRFDRPGVGTGQDHLALGQVLASRDAKPGFPSIELGRTPRLLGRIIGVPVFGVPNIAVPRVEEHAVAFGDRLQALPLDHLLHVLGGDDAGIAGTILLWDGKLSPAQRDGVEQNPAADEPNLRHVLNPERPQARGANAFVAHKASVVKELALGRVDADVARPVELRPNLSQLGRHIFDIANELLGARRRAGLGNYQVPASRAESRHVGRIYLAERRDLALLHQA